MKSIKVITSFVLSLTFAVLCFVQAIADDKLPPTGLIWDTWESYLEDMNENTLYALTTQRKGDVDGDGKITASDARLCLRASVALEVLTEAQNVAADVNNSFDITSADARNILRTSVGLESENNMTIKTTSDWGFVFGPLKNAGSGRYFWQCEVESDGLIFTQENVDNTDGKDGASEDIFFVFTPDKTGEYTVIFKLANSTQEEILEEFQIKVIVEA